MTPLIHTAKASRATLALLLTSCLLASLACSGERGGAGPGGAAPAGSTVRLQGAGATFPNPLYQKWLSEYGKLHPNVRIDYQSIGSGGGIKQIKEQTVDFGASDAPMNDEDMKGAPGELLHIPTVLGRGRPHLQPARRHAAAALLFRRHRRHLPRQDQALERPAHQGRQPRRTSSRGRHHGRPPLGRQRHLGRLHRLPLEGQPRVEREGRRGHVAELAGGSGRQRQRGRDGSGQADAEHDRLRRAGLRRAEQAARRPASRTLRATSSSRRSMP